MKLRERAYESFQQHLLEMRIRPGQFISQRELVDLTGLPLGAIREMIPRLEADGLIVTVPQRGMQIAAVDVKLVRNAFHLRTVLEREAIEHFTRVASDAEVGELVAENRDLLDRAEAGDRSSLLLDEAQKADWGLHDRLIDRLGNELIASVYRVNSLKIRLIRLEQSLLSAEVLLPALREHGEILAAIASRDVEASARTLERHIDSARLRAMGIAAGEMSMAGGDGLPESLSTTR
jgi:DNA-binding GntR family transcriptional regulator